MEGKTDVWDGIAQPHFRVLALSAAPWRSNLAIGLPGSRKMHDFQGKPYHLTCPSTAANDQSKPFDGASAPHSVSSDGGKHRSVDPNVIIATKQYKYMGNWESSDGYSFTGHADSNRTRYAGHSGG